MHSHKNLKKSLLWQLDSTQNHVSLVLPGKSSSERQTVLRRAGFKQHLPLVHTVWVCRAPAERFASTRRSNSHRTSFTRRAASAAARPFHARIARSRGNADSSACISIKP